MHREVFALLYKDSKDAPPLLPTDTGEFCEKIQWGDFV
jgi:DNA methyltransferase 1-associated protein 1